MRNAAIQDAPDLTDNFLAAEKIPLQIFSASAGTAPDVLREPGLILTKEQLINLKRYEVSGLALPVTIKDVVAYLGYETGAGPNLEATDFQKSFTIIRNHALRWDPIRTQLLNISSELSVFGGQMLTYQDSIKEIYDDLRRQPPGAVSEADHADFLDNIRDIADLVEQRSHATNRLKDELDSFAQDLATQVLPTVQIKLASIKNNNLPADIQRLNTDINDRATRIEEKQSEYKKLVGTAVATGILLLGLGIYFGVEAEKVRKELNALRQAQEKSVRELELKNTIQGSLQRVRRHLQDMELIVLDADIATKNLTTVWNALHTYVGESVRQAEKINDSLSLRRLMNGFNLVAAPWKTIQRDSGKLLEVFKQADDEYRAEYGHQ
ncbi:alpha-xenorhabdolysin family binary toxin subunit A [Pseudomonas sp. LP_7_YM]|uniref:alpha-xenorhabdolysin family binary toxin subunit A n=1 Tax=Pseudomonas sp. LP_7_YM TaxID=2485137 RepID=UPI0010D1A99C|nr:alpha-xenorhabdolysin family binary toxin subunit A [Pseudomonas sp. LP_7_YM]TDV59693.1 hypothetical protein EC915_11526 [Pseudomonas sp. LP_7_YM]